MKFSAFKTPAALAVALFAATAHAGFPDNADGSTNRALKGGNDEKKAKGTKAKSTTAAKQKKTHADDDEVDFIIKWKDEVGHEELANYATDRKVKDISGRQHLSAVHTNYSNLKSLKENPHIESVEEDFEVHALPFFRGEEFNRRLAESVPYGITMVQANDSVFAGAPGSDPIKICVIDTGYDINHDDLPQEGVTGFSPYGAGEEWNGDGHGHGTHCAGTIGAIGYNDVGVTSVNPYPDRFRFHIGKGLTNSGSGSSSGVIEAVENCAEAGAKVISMSLGGGGYSQAAQDLYTRLYEEDDILIIAAAGNGGNSALSYPASYKNVMSVAAVDSNENRAGFSQYNEQVEIAGPGVAVESTLPGNSYAAWSGTSMATPHVAGVAALVWSYFPGCTSENIRTVLLLTAKDKGATDCDPQYGYGIVQAKAAYDLLETDGCGAGDVDALAAKKRSCAFPPVPPPPCTAGSCTGHCEYCNADQVCEAAACTDNPLGWYDSDGATFDCDWYAQGSNCAAYGDSYENFGKTANQACCACGAGTCDATPPPIFPPTPPPTTPPPTPPPTTPPTPAPTSPPTPPPTAACPVVVNVEIVTDNWPFETTWTIKDVAGAVLGEGGPYSVAGATNTHTICAQDENFSFTIGDTYGDGICCSWGTGGYKVTVGGRVLTGGEFADNEQVSFGSACAPASAASGSSGPKMQRTGEKCKQNSDCISEFCAGSNTCMEAGQNQ